MLQADVIILGGGLVGSALAVALDAHGLSAVVVDPADPDTILAAGFDGRASAIAAAPWRMLQAIGVTPHIGAAGCPIEGIRVSDGLRPGKVDFAPEAGEEALGTMVENRVLRTALLAAVETAANVQLRYRTDATLVRRDAAGVEVTLGTGEIARAPLLIGAEGRNSPTREAAAIRTARWQYNHAALVASIRHARPHRSVAYEIFYPDGPFAILPLVDDDQGHRSCVVWSVRRDQAPGMMKLGERGFLAELSKAMGGFLGELGLAGPRFSYPLGFHHAARITAERLALVGDAGHGIHPIAGQGVNVGFRDVAALVEVLVDGRRLGLEPGDPALLARYDRWRSLDTFSVAVATDGLTRLFGLPGRLPGLARRIGLSAVDRMPTLKRRFIAEARGESGAMPKLLRGEIV